MLTLQSGALMFAAATTLTSWLLSTDCVVSWVLLGLSGTILLVILWPICGAVVVVAHHLTQLQSSARIAFHLLYGLEAAAGAWIYSRSPIAGAGAMIQVAAALALIWLPSARNAFRAARGSVTTNPDIGAGIGAAIVFGGGGTVLARRAGGPRDNGLAMYAWAGVWTALMRDPWARWATFIAVALAVSAAWTARPTTTLGADGLPARPSHAFIAARAETSLVAPGATAYITQIDGAECNDTADVFVDFGSGQPAVAAFAWYDQWLGAHGWKRQPPTPFQDEVTANGFPSADYTRGQRERFSIEFDSPDAPPYHGGSKGVTVPAGARSVFETSYVIDAPSGG